MISQSTIINLSEWYYENIKGFEAGTAEANQMIELINQWSTEIRRAVRTKLESYNHPDLIILRNLEYNYQTQEWI